MRNSITDLFKDKAISLFAMIIAMSALMAATLPHEYDPLKTTYYNSTGRITKAYKVWDAIVIPSAGSGQTIDISSAGFTSISSVVLTAANNTGSVASMPIAAIQSYSTTSITYNIIISNTAILALLAGLTTATSVTGTTIMVHVTGI